MEKIIEWCNLNNGFLTAILSMVGLLLSLTAIVVSVRTALLPFKKKIKISSFVSIAFSKNELTGEVHREVVGLCVNAANVGFRNANLVYLGILVKDSSGNVKKCAVGKHPKSEKLGSTGQAACCARIHSRYFTGGSPSGLRV